MAKKKRKTGFKTKAEREAWDAHVDETLRWARGLVEKGMAELRQKRGDATS